MKLICINILWSLLVICFGTKAQSAYDSVRLGIKPYGSLRGHLAVYNGEAELQENASRIGFELFVSKGSARYFVGSELSLNMFKGDVQFNPDASTSSGFIDIENDQANQVFGNRLGYLGVELKKAGTFVIGKQWSVYYDIAKYTDKFNVFGCKGSSIYTARTDGGTTGTGRADQAITYHNQVGPLTVGLQVQARSAFDDAFFDGYGLSGQLRINDRLSIGAAYYRALLKDTLQENTIGFNHNPEYLVFGVSYASERWSFGLVYADQSNGDLRRNLVGDNLAAVVFDAQGVEAYAKYTMRKFSFMAGYNGYNPETGKLPLNNRFGTEYFIAGMEYHPAKFAYFYCEVRIGTDKNRDHLGVKDLDVFTLGLRIDAERTLAKIVN